MSMNFGNFNKILSMSIHCDIIMLKGGGPMRILLCDDSLTIRKKLSQQIRSVCDCDIMEAKNGQAAIEAYIAHRPNLVLMDILMPVKDGLDALNEIMLHDPKAKVIMLSSVGTKDNLQKALKAGAIDFMQKPFNKERLIKLFGDLEKEN